MGKNMKKIKFASGAFGNPKENRLPWLKREIENLGHAVFIPRFPTPENQTLQNFPEDIISNTLDTIQYDKSIALLHGDTI